MPVYCCTSKYRPSGVGNGVADGVGCYLISFMKSFFCGITEVREIKEPLAVSQKSEMSFLQISVPKWRDIFFPTLSEVSSRAALQRFLLRSPPDSIYLFSNAGRAATHLQPLSQSGSSFRRLRSIAAKPMPVLATLNSVLTTVRLATD